MKTEQNTMKKEKAKTAKGGAEKWQIMVSL